MSIAAVSLADWLRAQPDERLAALLAARPDLLHPVPSDVTTLAKRASSRASVEVALDRLDIGCLQTLEALALLSSPNVPSPSLPALARLLDVAPAALGRPIAALRDAGLVFGPDDELATLPVVHDLLPFPAALGPPARLALAEIPTSRLPGVLADLAALLGDPPPDTDGRPASELLELIARHFEDDAALDRLLAAIPSTPREVVDLLAAGPPVGRTGGARRPVDAATAQSPLAWLLAHAILTPLDDYTVVLPREIGLRLRDGQPLGELVLEPPALPGPTHPAKTVDATAAGQAFTAVRLVESLLERWGIEPPGVLRAGGLGVRELRRAARELEVDERTAALVIEVAHVSGLLAPDADGGEAWLPTTGYDGWLSRPTAARWATLAVAWLATTRVPALVGRREPEHLAGPGGPVGGRSPSAANALGPDVDRALAPIVRRAVLAVLAKVEPGHAHDADALVDAVGWRMLRRGGRLRDDLVRWSGEEAELLGITGRGALSSFGRALVAASGDDDGQPADASADPAAAAIALLDPLLPQPLDHVLLQADLTAIAPGPLESDFGRELALLADVESTGGATVYRFSASSIRRALDAGYAAADIQALLAQRSRTPVPQPLQYLVDDVARRHGRLRVGAAGAYLRCDDDALLGEVIADRRAESLRLHRIAPSVAISPLAPERVAQRLRELGYAPGAESPDGGLLLRRPDTRRTSARPRLARPRAEFAPPSEAMLTMAVRAIRGGDKAAKAAAAAMRRAGADKTPSDALPHSIASDTLAALHEAVAANHAVWIGYLNAQGQASSRIVEPLRLAGGYLTAFDHRHDEVRTFAVHRITGVAALDEAGAAPPDTTDEAI